MNAYVRAFERAKAEVNAAVARGEIVDYLAPPPQAQTREVTPAEVEDDSDIRAPGMSGIEALLGGYKDEGGSRIPRGYRLGRRAYSRLARSALRMQKRYMPSQYGRAYIRRGTPLSLNLFGKDSSSANEMQKAMRKQLHYSGKGGYLGRMIGGALGAKFGMGTIGASLGDRAGDWLSDRARSLAGRYFGRGDYTAGGAGSTELAVANSIVTAPNIVHAATPLFGPLTDGSVRLTRKEFVANIFAPDVNNLSFRCTTFPLNPGMEQTFPWLSQIAQNYTDYEFEQLAFTFESSISALMNTTGQSGTLLMVTEYNANKPAYTSEFAMENASMPTVGSIMENGIQGVECDPRKLSGSQGKYVRASNNAATAQSLTDYDHGTLNVATANVTAGLGSQQLGKLYVSYTVVLRKPQVFTGLAKGIGRDVYVAPAPVSWQVPFGSAGGPGVCMALGNSLGTKLTATENWIDFPGSYTGWVRIRLKMTRLPLTGEIEGIGIAGIPSMNPASTTSGVKKFADIPRPAAAGESAPLGADIWDHVVYTAKTSYADGAPYLSFDMEGHFRITAAPIGMTNRIVFATGIAATPSNGLRPPMTALLEISEYNPSLSISDSGTNDQLLLVDTAGNRVTLPYMGTM